MPNNVKYYHGTSVAGLEVILPPIETGNLREDFRDKFQDCVFVTDTKMSAEKYARKSAQKNGGTPVVYEVDPVDPFRINVGQYICDKAYVLNSYEVQ